MGTKSSGNYLDVIRFLNLRLGGRGADSQDIVVFRLLHHDITKVHSLCSFDRPIKSVVLHDKRYCNSI